VAFTYDITTDRGLVRIKLSDTDSAAYVFEDAEIDAFLSREGTVDGATVALLRVLLVDRARRAKRFSMQGLSLDDTAQIQALQAAIEELYTGPTVSIVMGGSIPQDRGFTEPVVG